MCIEAQAVTGGMFGEGVGRVWLDNIQCTGSEQSLMNCSSQTASNCTHSRDAGVRCQQGKL